MRGIERQQYWQMVHTVIVQLTYTVVAMQKNIIYSTVLLEYIFCRFFIVTFLIIPPRVSQVCPSPDKDDHFEDAPNQPIYPHSFDPIDSVWTCNRCVLA